MLKKDEASKSSKLLRLYQRLLLDGRKHYQTELTKWLNCSTQTVMRLVVEIGEVVGDTLATGMDGHRRWYQMRPVTGNRLGLDFEELRFLALCRDLSAHLQPEHVLARMDESLLDFSLYMTEAGYVDRERGQRPRLAFHPMGHIDYRPHVGHIEALLLAADEKRVCRVLYRAGTHQKARERLFAPGHFAAMSGTLYALGGDVTPDGGEFRSFTNLAVHRMVDVKPTDTRAPGDIPPVDPGLFGLPWHEPRTFSIRFRPGTASDYVRERVWSDSQELRELPDGGVELVVTTRSEPELAAWTRAFGDDVVGFEKI